MEVNWCHFRSIEVNWGQFEVNWCLMWSEVKVTWFELRWAEFNQWVVGWMSRHLELCRVMSDCDCLAGSMSFHVVSCRMMSGDVGWCRLRWVHWVAMKQHKSPPPPNPICDVGLAWTSRHRLCTCMWYRPGLVVPTPTKQSRQKGVYVVNLPDAPVILRPLRGALSNKSFYKDTLVDSSKLSLLLRKQCMNWAPVSQNSPMPVHSNRWLEAYLQNFPYKHVAPVVSRK